MRRNWIAWLRIKWLDMRYRPGPGDPCGKCPTCRTGMRHRCPRVLMMTQADLAARMREHGFFAAETSPEETA